MNRGLRATALLGVLMLCACAVPRPAAPPPAVATGLSASQLVSAVQEDTERIDQAADPAQRLQLLASADAKAQQCIAQASDNGACHYVRAQVLGLTARERPVQAVSLLKQMLAELKQAEALDPGFDHAGPARLTATVLLRAPGWPLGPGDADAALPAAQRAVERDALYPPNLITLAQAQAKTDASTPARATYERARGAVSAWKDATPAAAARRDGWQKQIDQGVRELP